VHQQAVNAARLFSAFCRVSRILPLPLAWRLGAGLGDLVGMLPIREVRRAREHLGRAFPERDQAWVQRTARRVFRHMGRMALWSIASLGHDPRDLRRRVALEGADHLRDVIRATRRKDPTVILTGHIGNWELMARLAGTLLPITVVGKRLRNPLADELVQTARQAGGARLLYQDGDIRTFIKELRDGRVLATLPDQDIERLAHVFVPWFGIPACTPSGPAMLAVLTKSAVQPAFLYAKHGRWVLHCGPRRRFAPSGNREADATAITAWVMAYHEGVVRRAPEQWVWWHKRWRTRPPSESG
jgi:KDO2-lipid IV(A) lauroyltransferase